MVRKTTREQLDRLTVKTLDQVFIARAKEGLNCSLFEAQALTDLIKEVYFPWLSRPEAIQAGQVGDAIAIRAHDDFDVTGVSVTLTEAGGAALESGAAVETPPDSGRWVYTTPAAAPTGTAVRATDLPGGVGSAGAAKTV